MVTVRYDYSNGYCTEIVTKETTGGSVAVEVTVHGPNGPVMAVDTVDPTPAPAILPELTPDGEDDDGMPVPLGELTPDSDDDDAIPAPEVWPEAEGSLDDDSLPAAPPLQESVDKKLGAFAARKDIPAKTRAVMGFIRAMWTTFFAAFGFGITWLVDNYSSLHLPAYLGLVIGAVAYGLKKYLFPDTLL